MQQHLAICVPSAPIGWCGKVKVGVQIKPSFTDFTSQQTTAGLNRDIGKELIVFMPDNRHSLPRQTKG